MKTSIEKIRHYACGELLFYRSMYKVCRDNLIIVNDDVINNMHNHYIMLRGLYNCELVSVDTINRAYYMYFNIKYGR